MSEVPRGDHVIGLSLEPLGAESEFLLRELGIKWQTCGESELLGLVLEYLERNSKALLICSDISLYANTLKKLPKDSVVVFLLSDESYKLSSFQTIKKSNSVAALFRHYGLQRAPVSIIFQEFSRLYRSIPSIRFESFSLLRIVITGLRTRYRMRRWRTLDIDIIPVCLGYTDKFIKEFDEHPCNENSFKMNSNSLFQQEPSWNMIGRSLETTFRGVKGQLQRRIRVLEISSNKNVDIVLSEGPWAGHKDSDLDGYGYVDSLFRSRTALCPPGYLNNESFRYYEALLCGADPIEDPVAITHMGLNPARPSKNTVTSINEKFKSVQNHLLNVRRLLLLHLQEGIGQ